MVEWETVRKLMMAFPNSFINYHGEFIAHRGANQYFNLSTCYNELDVKCKTLEYLSRSACKTMQYSTKKRNETLWEFMRTGINTFLQTEFTRDDMMKIYTYLGNGVNRAKCVRFIESGYDMRILNEGEA